MHLGRSYRHGCHVQRLLGLPGDRCCALDGLHRQQTMLISTEITITGDCNRVRCTQVYVTFSIVPTLIFAYCRCTPSLQSTWRRFVTQ